MFFDLLLLKCIILFLIFLFIHFHCIVFSYRLIQLWAICETFHLVFFCLFFCLFSYMPTYFQEGLVRKHNDLQASEISASAQLASMQQ